MIGAETASNFLPRTLILLPLFRRRSAGTRTDTRNSSRCLLGCQEVANEPRTLKTAVLYGTKDPLPSECTPISLTEKSALPLPSRSALMKVLLPLSVTRSSPGAPEKAEAPM